ncbi:acyl CoA:acetate/3-ketoacid CoA transferase [Azoarcus sp. KH32C]|uniref:acyl CoA:acetate/3-ketoacid CoA transferase n=1 Tax=Azoarcus sp. KH32C TaxID=748247 RepID=UPI0002385C41|nr:acyl CoA:acetate/3-ketoacid CoA transferase [Azoarcus sp. KH32C]BAL27412.1 coenzyme A transferase [Azoarcus sp. KH32C]
MAINKFMSAADAVALVRDGDTVGLIGGGGGLVEASCIFAALEKRFLDTAQPRNLTVVHALGIGDKKSRGMNCFAYEGMVKRVIGGHWVWSPRMQELARDEKIEAYVLPGGVIAQLFREIGAGRPGLLTHVGLGTFVDPRLGGGRMNKAAKEDLVEVVELGGKEYLRYKPFPVNVAIIRGSYADAHGNISLDQEPANLDAYAVALAAHNSGGKVIAQVRTAVDVGTLPARSVRIPGALVDAVVVDPSQSQSYDIVYDPTISGERRGPVPVESAQPLTVRQATARRAAEELRDGAVINYGVGVPDAVAKLVAARGDLDRYYQTIEHGTYGGTLLDGMLFGFARNASAMIDAPSQFDFYSGGGLDIAFLGFGEFDRHGNVNASKLGGLTVGPGGFIDIAQNARKVVFCGNFDTKGSKITTGHGELVVERNGDVPKLVADVDQITFSGPQAVVRGQEVLYITERAMFRLTKEGVVLEEIAPGVDLQRDILDRMGFTPLMPRPPKVMNGEHFKE